MVAMRGTKLPAGPSYVILSKNKEIIPFVPPGNSRPSTCPALSSAGFRPVAPAGDGRSSRKLYFPPRFLHPDARCFVYVLERVRPVRDGTLPYLSTNPTFRPWI